MKDVTRSMKGKTQSNKITLPKFSLNLGRPVLYGLAAVFLGLFYYITLPPIHWASGQFWTFFFLILLVIGLVEFLVDSKKVVKRQIDLNWQSLKKAAIKYKVLAGIGLGLWLVGIIANFIFSPFFMSQAYSQQLVPVEADFATEFPQTDLTKIPLIDRDTAALLGDRRVGALTDLVSQFEAANDYTQISIAGAPYRVSPLEYAGFWKWVSNQSQGIPSYLKVDMVSGDVSLESPSQPIRYSHSEYFFRNIKRHLRFAYPFEIFGSPSFEVDDQGNPYYVATTFKRNFFLREPEVSGLVIANAMTGETQKVALDQIPSWVDRVYPAQLIMHQLSMNGKYQNGFWNTLFSKKGVTMPTEGYNYLPLGDDVYLYTGITSVAADESNIGFVLANLRTKESKIFYLSAAEEFSAMESAQGSVQETGYQATFPLLISIEGKPMYILSLKDDSGLIKMYALIDVQNYQNVYVANSVNKLMQEYQSDHPTTSAVVDPQDLSQVEGPIEAIQSAVVDGNTLYYIKIGGQIYRAPITVSLDLPFLGQGQEVVIKVDSQGLVQELQVNAVQ